MSDVKPVSILRPLVEELAERRSRARLGGGEERIARQHEAGKLTARERIALLIDDGTFTELGVHARPHFSQRAMDGREAPAEGQAARAFARPCPRRMADCTMANSARFSSVTRPTRRPRCMTGKQRSPWDWSVS